jgi:hypothetical protein
MPEMYCPKCGRELELDSGEISFCRYCGFSLVDTKEALHGYSAQKRIGFSVVTWSYALLLMATLLLHGQYISLNTGWVYWLLTILIVVSVSLFSSATMSASMPALFLKIMRRDKATLKPPAASTGAIKSVEGHALLSSSAPVSDLNNQGGNREPVTEPRSIIEGTTKKLNDRSQRPDR